MVRLRCIQPVLIELDLIRGRPRSTVDILRSDIQHVDGDSRLSALGIAGDSRRAHIIPGAWDGRIVEADARLARPDVFNIRAWFERSVDIRRIPHLKS